MHKCVNNSVGNVYHLEQLVGDFFPYSQEKLGFDQEATIVFQSDEDNSSRLLGKTAHYDPENFEIVLYVDGRHPKDVMRSLSHELVHHAQNCRGDFTETHSTDPGYAQKDPHLRKMEREAYTKGNLIFRDFEDLIKTGKINLEIDFSETGEPLMSLKEWKNNEINTRLMKKWGLLKEGTAEGSSDTSSDTSTSDDKPKPPPPKKKDDDSSTSSGDTSSGTNTTGLRPRETELTPPKREPVERKPVDPDWKEKYLEKTDKSAKEKMDAGEKAQREADRQKRRDKDIEDIEKPIDREDYESIGKKKKKPPPPAKKDDSSTNETLNRWAQLAGIPSVPKIFAEAWDDATFKESEVRRMAENGEDKKKEGPKGVVVTKPKGETAEEAKEKDLKDLMKLKPDLLDKIVQSVEGDGPFEESVRSSRKISIREARLIARRIIERVRRESR